MWTRHLEADDDLRQMSEYLRNNVEPKDAKIAKWCKYDSKYFYYVDDMLVRTITYGPPSQREITTVLCVPELEVKNVLRKEHNAGHPGFKLMLTKLRSKYWWKSMITDIHTHVTSCITCQEFKRAYNRKAVMGGHPGSTEKMGLVAMDLLQLPRTDRGYQYVLVCIDAFSRFAIASPLRTKAAKEVVYVFEETVCKVFSCAHRSRNRVYK